MNLKEIVNSEFEDNKVYTIEEGILNVSPAIAIFAFKDSVINKMEKLSHPIKSAIGGVAAGVEKAKANVLGKSGNKDNDTVYALTKEQKKVMAYIYKKYGADMVNEISNFRKQVMPAYNLIKRNVAKNKSLTNKEIHGMTKEDYYRFRESGKKKIEKKGTYFKDYKELNSKQVEAREALAKIEKTYTDFKAGKIIDLSATNIEKMLDEAGLGRKNLNGWSDNELERTATEIRNITARMNNPNLQQDGAVRLSKKTWQSKEQLEFYIKKLQEEGYSQATGKKMEDIGEHRGSFKDAFSMYMLRAEARKEIKNNLSKSQYRKFCEKVLKDAVEAAKKIYNEKFENYISLNKTIELNQYEKKIWGLKINGVEYSGNINDWYLKIKPEDFIDTKYYKKTDSIIEAEKEMDRKLKALERKLRSKMSEEDVALCRKYRLFNNFLTIKELKSANNLFKDGKIPNSSETKKTNNEENFVDIGELLDSVIGKHYTSIRDLEEQQKKIKEIVKDKKLTPEEKEKYNLFIHRIDPGKSEATKTDTNKLNNLIEKINGTAYTGKTQASNDLKELEDVAEDYKSVNGETEYKKFVYDINKARGKLLKYIEGDK